MVAVPPEKLRQQVAQFVDTYLAAWVSHLIPEKRLANELVSGRRVLSRHRRPLGLERRAEAEPIRDPNRSARRSARP